MAVTLDGPRLAAKSRTAEQLVVFLHGYGANGNDLIAIGQQWRALLPGAAFVAPNAVGAVRASARRAPMVSFDHA